MIEIQTAGVCSPSRTENYKNFKSCMNISELRTLALAYNKIVEHFQTLKKNQNNSNSKMMFEGLILKKINMPDFKNFETLHKALNTRFAKKCGNQNESCWVEHPLIKNKHNISEYLLKIFRPIMNKDWIEHKNILLNTFEILDVMKQYDEQYPDFQYLGTFPLDFMRKRSKDQCIIGKVCHFDLADFFLKGKKHLGIVFNLDTHDKPGSHWVAFYSNFDPNDIRFGFYYYDSYGKEEPSDIQECYHFFKDQYDNILEKQKDIVPKQNMPKEKKGPNKNRIRWEKKEYKFHRNQIRHQYKNTECGMFSIIFIVMCLQNPNTPIEENYEKMFSPEADNIAFSYRQKLFRKPQNNK